MLPDNPDRLRLRLLDQLLRLSPAHLGEVEAFLRRLAENDPTPASDLPAFVSPPLDRDWPHAPLHQISEQGTYIVTSGTYDKAHFFRGPERLSFLEASLLSKAKAFGWQLEAWAVFSNHYHFVGHSPADPRSLRAFVKELHFETACHVNRLDQLTDRQVWFNYWETRLTYEKSYLARLSYVHRNAVKHGLVSIPGEYRWCSAAWLERTATRAQVETLYRFKIDRLSIEDPFDPV